MIFYVPLKDELSGYYVKVEAPKASVVTAFAASRYGDLFSGKAYTEAYYYECIRRRYRTKVINDNPIVLTEEVTHEV